jgi:hypothetical protein
MTITDDRQMTGISAQILSVRQAVADRWPHFDFTATRDSRYTANGIVLSWVREPGAPAPTAVLDVARQTLAGQCDVGGKDFRIEVEHIYPLETLVAALMDEWKAGRLMFFGGRYVVLEFPEPPDAYRPENLSKLTLAFISAVCEVAKVSKNDYTSAHRNRSLTFLKDQLSDTLALSGDAIAAAAGYDYDYDRDRG